MDDIERDKEQLLEELNSLRQKVIELEKRKTYSREDSLKLAVVENAPFTMWACDRNFKIVIWNEQAKKVYGYSAREAIGKDFVELFVDEPEQEQARKDCIAIIDNGETFDNFLANDNDQFGNSLTMLTNCFRIWDEETRQFLQVEIGLEISDYDQSVKKHRTLREAGKESVALRKRYLEFERKSGITRLGTIFHDQLSAIETKIREEKNAMNDLIRKRVYTRDQVENIFKDVLEALNDAKRTIKNRYEELQHNIMDAKTLEEIDLVAQQLAEFDNETFMPEINENQ